MANVALLVRKRWVRELRHQLRLCRLVRIVALHAIGSTEGLISMGLLQARVLHIVTINTQRRCRFCQVIIELLFSSFANLVCYVAGLATHIERHVPATLFGNIQSGGMASEAEIFFLVPSFRL